MIDTSQKILDILTDLNNTFLEGQTLSSQIETLIRRQTVIMKINDKNYDSLLRYRIIFLDSFIWQYREKYFRMINQFLENQIDGQTFCNEIQSLYNQNTDQAREIETNLEYKMDFQLTSKSMNFSKLVENLIALIEFFDSRLDDSESSLFGLSENGLKSEIKKIIIPKILEYLN